MSITQWAGLAVSVTTLIGAVAIGIRHLVKHYFMELKPNGGSSLKDSVSSISTKVDKLEARVDDIYRLLINK